MVVDVKDDLKEREQKRIFFESEEEKEAFQSDIRKLLQQCEVYRNDVVVGLFSLNAIQNIHRLLSFICSTSDSQS
jgi:hypothetical protein